MKRTLSLVAALLAVGARLLAASDYLLEIEGIKGESKDKEHPGAIEVASWSLGASNPTSVGAGGMSAGKASFQDIHFTIPMDSASPALFLHCASGKHIAQAVITARTASPTGDGKKFTFLTITLTDVLVSSITINANSEGQRPIESLSFSYAKIKFDYRAPGDDGVEPIPPFEYDVVKVIPVDPATGAN